MPELDTPLHVDMLKEYHDQNTFVHRVRRAVREVVFPNRFYGLQWGDPELSGPQVFMRNKYVLPYINPKHIALEIGPGGGRWTRYLLGFKKLYVVDHYPQLLNELKKRFNKPTMQFITNNGTDFPGVPDKSIDYIVSVACFVHLEPHLIESYLKNMVRILKPGGNVFLTYSDKTKVGAQINHTFTNVTPGAMREMISSAGFKIVEEDLTILWNSGVVLFTR